MGDPIVFGDLAVGSIFGSRESYGNRYRVLSIEGVLLDAIEVLSGEAFVFTPSMFSRAPYYLISDICTSSNWTHGRSRDVGI